MTSRGSKRSMSEIDLSAAAITGRLRRVEQLRRLCISLGCARPPTAHKLATRPPAPDQRSKKNVSRNATQANEDRGAT